MAMSFEDWIATEAKAGDNPVGDFIRDTRGVMVPPRWKNGDINSLSDLRNKMMWVGTPCEESFEAAEACWNQYLRFQSRASANAAI
jgi:hypothetical protein